jgi:hypothetical protein
LAVGALVGVVVAGCGGSKSGSGFGTDGATVRVDGGSKADVASGGVDATTHKPVDSGSPGMLGDKDTGAGKCVPSTCTELNANCGVVTDKKCNDVVNCGTCGAGETCGAGGPSRCGPSQTPVEGGVVGDSCAHQTCASQMITCGPASDQCGGQLSCGTCNAPQTCGGDPTKPGQCGCTGLCAQVATCGGTTTTDLIGTVLDPAGANPLYNVLVYVPNDPTDPGLQPFAPGINCDICGATAAGDPLVTTYTAVNGTFTLKGVPTGTAVPVVIQLGRWRRQFTVAVSTPCAANSIPGGTFTMPSDHTQGDMPRIAIVTGAWDPVECALRDIGIAQSEFTNPGGSGYMNLYTADDPNNPYSSGPYSGGYGPGAMIDSNTPNQDALYATTGPGPAGTPQVQPVINNYDMVILECEGYPETESASQQAALATYLGAGGRVFGSHYTYDWFYKNPALMGAVNWRNNLDSVVGGPVTATVDLPPTNPAGTAFDQWLETVGVTTATTFGLSPAYALVSGVVPPTQEWLYSGGTGGGHSTIQFTFNTPIGATAAQQCGRATFNAWHAFPAVSGQESTTFPHACGSDTASSHQEKILEFMLFDLSACVQPYTPICTPETCAAQNITCGPAGDGCGNLIQCGTCPSGEVCGGGGPGKCGTSTTTTTCAPQSCMDQGIACGPAGDGCGNEIQCGNCSTGQICGFSSPGQCGGGSGPAVRAGHL